MNDINRQVQNSQLLAELICSLLVYWSSSECFFTDSRFSYYQSKYIELDYKTAENLVLNFSKGYFPDTDELIGFIDGLYDNWMINNNIKKHYGNFLDLVKEISEYSNYFNEFCHFAYQYDKDYCLCEEFYEREDKAQSLKVLIENEILFEHSEVFFDGLDFSNLIKNTKVITGKEIIEEEKPLENILEQQASIKKSKKLTNIFNKLMDSGHE